MITVYDGAYEKHEYPDATNWESDQGELDIYKVVEVVTVRSLFRFFRVEIKRVGKRYLASYSSDGWTYVERT